MFRVARLDGLANTSGLFREMFLLLHAFFLY